MHRSVENFRLNSRRYLCHLTTYRHSIERNILPKFYENLPIKLRVIPLANKQTNTQTDNGENSTTAKNAGGE